MNQLARKITSLTLVLSAPAINAGNPFSQRLATTSVMNPEAPRPLYHITGSLSFQIPDDSWINPEATKQCQTNVYQIHLKACQT